MRCDSHLTTRRALCRLGILSCHVLDQIHNAAGVAPLIVIPRNNLHKGWVQHDAGLGIEGGRSCAGLEVGGDERLIAVTQESLHVTLRAPLDLCADVFVGRLCVQLAGQVNDRHVDGGHAECHSCELALHGRDDFGHGLCSASGGWDDIPRRSTAPAPVLLRCAVHCGLRRGHCMDRGHETPLDAELVMESLDCRRQAVCGAGGARDARHRRVVRLLVDAHDNRVRVILGRCREHHFLGTGCQVALDFLLRQEHPRGLTHIRPVEGDLCRVPRARQGNLLAVNHQATVPSLNGAIVPAVDGVILHHVGQVLRIVAGVDELQVALGVLHGDARHLPADAPKAVDGNGHGPHGHRRRTAAQ
mmetsp:Transcript_94711/g.219931  ORF Transcript_94711/g.219931 Transcript_94711/m.219931 type:complete len:359 (-) Transcript_94711:274-1350(-)